MSNAGQAGPNLSREDLTLRLRIAMAVHARGAQWRHVVHPPMSVPAWSGLSQGWAGRQLVHPSRHGGYVLAAVPDALGKVELAQDNDTWSDLLPDFVNDPAELGALMQEHRIACMPADASDPDTVWRTFPDPWCPSPGWGVCLSVLRDAGADVTDFLFTEATCPVAYPPPASSMSTPTEETK
jgi:hypothetical protein